VYHLHINFTKMYTFDSICQSFSSHFYLNVNLKKVWIFNIYCFIYRSIYYIVYHTIMKRVEKKLRIEFYWRLSYGKDLLCLFVPFFKIDQTWNIKKTGYLRFSKGWKKNICFILVSSHVTTWEISFMRRRLCHIFIFLKIKSKS